MADEMSIEIKINGVTRKEAFLEAILEAMKDHPEPPPAPDYRSKFTFVIPSDNKTLDLYLTQSAAKAVTVDWGDGTTADNPTETTPTLSHTYAAAGTYTVIIDCADGQTWTVGQTAVQHFTNTGTNYETRLTQAIIGGAARLTYGGGLSYCTDLVTVTVLDGGTIIQLYMFRGCIALATADLPSTVADMKASVFSGDSAMASLTVRATTPPTLASTALNGLPATCAIYVPAGSVSAYKAASGWSARADYIQAIPG